MRGRRSDRRGDLLQLRRPALFLLAVLRNDNNPVGNHSDNLYDEFHVKEYYENNHHKAAQIRRGHIEIY